MPKSELRGKSYGSAKFQFRYFICVQPVQVFLSVSNPRLIKASFCVPKINPKTLEHKIFTKTKKNSLRPVDPELGRNDPFLPTTGFTPIGRSPATTLLHAPSREEQTEEASLAVKFSGHPTTDAPRSGRRSPPAGVFLSPQFVCFSTNPAHPIPLSHPFRPL